MFGYVTVNQPELKFREFDWYHSFYCGLCRQLHEDYGISGQLTLTYDMTFLVILLTGLYEPETPSGSTRCTTHPLHKHETRINEYTSYASDMNILLAYFQCLDDWQDDHDLTKKLVADSLRSGYEKVCQKYPLKAQVVSDCLHEIHLCEEEKDPDLDRAAGWFGKLTGEVFACRQDEWEKDLRAMGFYLGKFIYLMDAWEDREKDRKKGSYNPFLLKYPEGDHEKDMEECLTMMMAECCRAFEHLPILTGTEVLRNILYAGVWTKYEAVKMKRKEKKNV